MSRPSEIGTQMQLFSTFLSATGGNTDKYVDFRSLRSKIVDLIFGLRVGEQHEIEGLDLTQHGEVAYVYALKANSDETKPAVRIVEKSNVISSAKPALEMGE